MEIQEYLKERIQSNTFLQYLGLEPTKVENGFFEGKINIKKELTQQDGFAHGGVVASILDMAAGFASYSLLEPPKRCLTIEIKVSYLRPGTAEILYVEGQVIKAGQRVHFCESEVYQIQDGEKLLLAKATATMAII